MAVPASKSVVIHEVNAASAQNEIVQARELLLAYGRFVIAQHGAAQFCFGSLEKEAERLPASYSEQGGGCLIAYADFHPAGFVAWRELPVSVAPAAWELKRLWVRPEARGVSLGKMLTEAVLDRARKSGRSAVYLDTAPASMAAANRTYLSLGFVPCPRYNDNPVEGLAYLVKHL